MKIGLTGGGTGGHFYPIIAVAEALRKQANDRKLVDLELYYFAPQPYDESALFENKITYVRVGAGKLRPYLSLENITDAFKTVAGVVTALRELYHIYPDVIFSKGGYVAFPVMLAARLLRIPVIMHESDSVPGKTNAWTASFARRIAVSFPDAAHFFDAQKVAITGNPIRAAVAVAATKDAGTQLFNLEPGLPVVLVLGGSQGAQIINETILDALPELVKKYHIIHQVGKAHLVVTQKTIDVILANNPNRARYIFVDNFTVLKLRAAAGAADIVVTRAGSTLFEIATWGVPSLVVPITKSNGDHQRKNAYGYARTGAAVVIEENNLTAHILLSEINRLTAAPDTRASMSAAARAFSHTNAADLIATELITVGLEHEQ